MDPYSLWCKVVTGIHNLENKPAFYLSNKNIPGVWNNIANVKKDLQKSKFPDLYAIESNKQCTVAQKVTDNGNAWCWKSCPLALGLFHELSLLYSDINSYPLTHGDDQWKCNLAMDGKYKVEVLRRKLDHKLPQVSNPTVVWYKEAPIKVLGFIWRATMGHIPTTTALARRGITISSSACGSCVRSDEHAAHLLVSCPFATSVQEKILTWCGVTSLLFQWCLRFRPICYHMGQVFEETKEIYCHMLRSTMRDMKIQERQNFPMQGHKS
uniref:Reverse transcriptase zinc-binding domain-containing protein n=1 Tax=Lactuca sativa TaxID=4236 RepID=A0A9R1XLH3_LACSA|nr:hypothetical protein LSAT_V11C300118220 [Lactuca sativa]